MIVRENGWGLGPPVRFPRLVCTVRAKVVGPAKQTGRIDWWENIIGCAGYELTPSPSRKISC